ncbi:MAG: NAD(P)/FAD-dependent oxidoreductase [Candidatus Helarchaeota archaeon]|nr:NAD(P)/FAD-dependent oxidoreductase [Candidatus Helarchaeota archaeon]
MYDVVISGAGPAGAMAGQVLAKAGYKVILYDKAKLPWRKPCGGGVPEHVFSAGLLDYNEMKRKKIIDKDTKNLFLRASSGKELLIDTPGETVVDRKLFDQYLRDKALEAGAEIQDQTSVRELSKNQEDFVNGVKIKEPGGFKEISSKIVIVADGVGSKLVVKGGLRKKWKPTDYAICAVAIIEGYIESEPLSNSMQIYIDDDVAPNSYAWLFPMSNNRANIGIGIWKRSEKRPMEFLKRLVEQPFFKQKLDPNEFRFFWKSGYPIPIQGVKGRTYGNGIMGVGDSMGFVAPIIGEGIFSALLTGKLAAKTAVTALELGDYSKKVLKEYQKAWIKYGLKDGYNFQRMMRDAVVESGSINDNFDNLIDWALEDEQNKKLLGEMFVSGTSLVGKIPPELIAKITSELMPKLKITK